MHYDLSEKSFAKLDNRGEVQETVDVFKFDDGAIEIELYDYNRNMRLFAFLNADEVKELAEFLS